MSLLETILVPTDFSETSGVAVQYGCSLAETLQSTLHLVHVVESPHLSLGGAALWGYSLPAFIDRLEDAAENRMAALASEWEPTLTIERAARVGQPFVEIIRYAREKDVDVIVMGTRGRGAMAHLLLGSVAQKVVRMASCPVLTIRDPGHEFVLP